MKINQVTILFLAAALFTSPAIGLESASKAQNAKKIAKLKSELNSAKGERRLKLIKKIAEIENRNLEHKLQSFK